MALRAGRGGPPRVWFCSPVFAQPVSCRLGRAPTTRAGSNVRFMSRGVRKSVRPPCVRMNSTLSQNVRLSPKRARPD
eukprot:2685015-Lingulodinium_polyedra.AAC.1